MTRIDLTMGAVLFLAILTGSYAIALFTYHFWSL